MVENKIIFETENVFRSKLCKSNSNSAWNELAFPVFTLTYLYGIYVWKASLWISIFQRELYTTAKNTIDGQNTEQG